MLHAQHNSAMRQRGYCGPSVDGKGRPREVRGLAQGSRKIVTLTQAGWHQSPWSLLLP